MISDTYQCIFVHQRKCGGISVLKAFDDPPFISMTPDNPDWHFMNDGVLSPEYHTRPMDYYRFATVRNPWDRFVSGWKYCEGTRDIPLHDLLLALPQLEHDYIHLTRLQRSILYDRAGYRIVEKLMRFENLQHDFDEVCDTIGKPRIELGHHNPSNHLHYREYFTNPVDVDLFTRHFALDIDTFEYEF